MFFEGKKVLIIGGTGTIGQGLVKQLLAQKVKVIRIYSRDEYKQFLMQDEYREYIEENHNIRFLIGDVRDKERLQRAMNGIDIVFNLAAMKHVPAAEYNPFEAVKTNVIGTQNVIDCAMDAGVKRVIYTSSDKAVSPTNTMGATKLVAERLIASADYYKGTKKMVFAAVRFGNVIGSRGSVLNLWKDQILSGKEITITDESMTRFMMTQEEAVKLTMAACERAEGGEIFVLKMPVLRLKDLADIYIEEICKKYNIDKESIKIKNIGLRTGEKMYEELMSEKEASESLEFDEMFAIMPGHKQGILKSSKYKRAEIKSYSSSEYECMSKDAIRNYVFSNGLI